MAYESIAVKEVSSSRESICGGPATTESAVSFRFVLQWIIVISISNCAGDTIPSEPVIDRDIQFSIYLTGATVFLEAVDYTVIVPNLYRYVKVP